MYTCSSSGLPIGACSSQCLAYTGQHMSSRHSRGLAKEHGTSSCHEQHASLSLQPLSSGCA